MTDVILERGVAIGEQAAARARLRVAAALRDVLPGVAVTVIDRDVVLVGRITADDSRLRWIGSVLR